MAERSQIAQEETKRTSLKQMSVCVPHYATSYSCVVATIEKSRAPGELNTPSGVAIHKDTHHIFVANQFKYKVEVDSEMGEFLYQLNVKLLPDPCGIATYGDSLYISCLGDHTVSRFSLSEMCRVRRIGVTDQTYISEILVNSQLIQLVMCTSQNPAKPLDIAIQCSRNIAEECYQQGDEERRLGLELSHLCDRHNPIFEKNQFTFITFVALPLWEAWSELVYSHATIMIDHLATNRDY